MKFAGRTDIGRFRKENQDNFVAQQGPENNCWGIVCDGMGGVRGGKLAAQIGVQTMNRYLEQNVEELAVTRRPHQVMAKGVALCNQAIIERARQSRELTGMGTTIVCACVTGKTAHLIHAGDSRIYLYRNETLTQLTHDHSMVQEMVDNGKLTPEEAAHHPQKNLITRALGVDNEIIPDYTKIELKPNDILLLCSDGLCNMVEDKKIAEILRQNHFYDAVDVLVNVALENGGQDNITVLLMGTRPTEDDYE